MDKLDMTGFSYNDGDSVSFNGSYGTVELTYHTSRIDDDIFSGKKEIPSHFSAVLICDDKIRCTETGVTVETAIENLYIAYAKSCALTDTGRV